MTRELYKHTVRVLKRVENPLNRGRNNIHWISSDGGGFMEKA